MASCYCFVWLILAKLSWSCVFSSGQLGKNQPTNIAGQIEELNQRVAEWSVPKIVADMEMYQTYLHDIENLPVPLTHPVSQSSAGTKSMPFKQFF